MSFYLEGYQTLTLQHTVLSEVVIAIKERLQPGVATPPAGELSIDTPELPEGDEAPGVPQATVGRLLLTIRPTDAAVYLDGHFLGTAGELAQLSAGLVVEPGRHVLELVRPGYHTEEVPLTVPAGEQLEIDLELRPR
ncbi:MAG: PEGA domain-containing protein [Thermoanaerobaculia bacterium]